MRIQSISTNNNPQFKRLVIRKPKEWDLDVLSAVVKNAEIRNYAKHFSSKGQDLELAYGKTGQNMLPGIVISTEPFDWKPFLHAFTKKELLEKLAKFKFSNILKKEEKECAMDDKLKNLLKEVDEFNEELN